MGFSAQSAQAVGITYSFSATASANGDILGLFFLPKVISPTNVIVDFVADTDNVMGDGAGSYKVKIDSTTIRTPDNQALQTPLNNLYRYFSNDI